MGKMTIISLLFGTYTYFFEKYARMLIHELILEKTTRKMIMKLIMRCVKRKKR